MITPVLSSELDDVANFPGADSFFQEFNLPGAFSKTAFIHNWKRIMDSNMGVMWKLVKDGKIAGMLGALLSPHLVTGETVATEAFWYVLPEERAGIGGAKLILTFELWAKEMGAKHIVMSHFIEQIPSKLAEYYIRRGYRPLEINYVKTL